jgi:hypothetical protein
MKPGKILAVASALIAFTATAQAEDSGPQKAARDASVAAGTMTTNKLAANKLAANKLAANKLAANKLAANRLAANKPAAKPGEGAAFDILAVELPDGTRLSR